MYTIGLLRLAQRELFKLPAGIQAALIKALDELEVYGHELREPVVRDIGKGLKELRVSAKEGCGRGFSFTRQIGRFISFISCRRKRKRPQDGH